MLKSRRKSPAPSAARPRSPFPTAPLKPAQTVRPDRAPAGQPPLRAQPPALPDPADAAHPASYHSAPSRSRAFSPPACRQSACVRPHPPRFPCHRTPRLCRRSAPSAPAPVEEASPVCGDTNRMKRKRPIFTANIAPVAPAEPVVPPVYSSHRAAAIRAATFG